MAKLDAMEFEHISTFNHLHDMGWSCMLLFLPIHDDLNSILKIDGERDTISLVRFPAKIPVLLNRCPNIYSGMN